MGRKSFLTKKKPHYVYVVYLENCGEFDIEIELGFDSEVCKKQSQAAMGFSAITVTYEFEEYRCIGEQASHRLAIKDKAKLKMCDA